MVLFSIGLIFCLCIQDCSRQLWKCQNKTYQSNEPMGWWIKLWSNIWLLSFHALWTKLSVWSKFLFIISCLFYEGVLPTGRLMLNLWYMDQTSSFDNSFMPCPSMCSKLFWTAQISLVQVPIVLDGFKNNMDLTKTNMPHRRLMHEFEFCIP